MLLSVTASSVLLDGGVAAPTLHAADRKRKRFKAARMLHVRPATDAEPMTSRAAPESSAPAATAGSGIVCRQLLGKKLLLLLPAHGRVTQGAHATYRDCESRGRSCSWRRACLSRRYLARRQQKVDCCAQTIVSSFQVDAPSFQACARGDAQGRHAAPGTHAVSATSCMQGSPPARALECCNDCSSNMLSTLPGIWSSCCSCPFASRSRA